jgi:hypothetical protein
VLRGTGWETLDIGSPSNHYPEKLQRGCMALTPCSNGTIVRDFVNGVIVLHARALRADLQGGMRPTLGSLRQF